MLETPVVFYFMWKLGPNMLEGDHPWVTGNVPRSADPIWPRNIAYSAPPKADRNHEEQQSLDRQALLEVGEFLASMVKKSLGPAVPHGPKRRMPHAVNYIHGAIHYNSAFFLFEDVNDMMAHVTCADFAADFTGFVKREKREPMFVLRKREIDAEDYTRAMGTIRAMLPFFANGNGPSKKPVLWGNYSPRPAINLISGTWMRDLRSLQNGTPLVMKPLDSREHFRTHYQGGRTHSTTWEEMISFVQSMDIRARGFRGQLFFTNRRKIEPERWPEYKDAGGYFRWSASHPAPWPKSKRGRR